MTPRIARETKREWSINVKREEGGFGCLIARGATSTRMDPQRLLGIGHGAIGEPILPCGASPALPASQRCPGALGGYVDLDGVVIQSSHVQINPKQSGLEMPRFGRAADETGQDSTELTGLDSTSHHGAPQARRHETDWYRLTYSGRFCTGQNGAFISTGHVVI